MANLTSPSHMAPMSGLGIASAFCFGESANNAGSDDGASWARTAWICVTSYDFKGYLVRCRPDPHATEAGVDGVASRCHLAFEIPPFPTVP